MSFVPGRPWAIANAPYTASSTGPRRAGRTSRDGTTNGIRVSRIRRLARTSRWAMAVGGTANAAAIWAASKPNTVCSINGVRTASSIAGCAHTNSNASRRSGMRSGSIPPRRSTEGAACTSSGASGTVRRWATDFHRSRCRLRATVTNHPSGFTGTPVSGQLRSACSKAADSASSADCRSPPPAATTATSRP